MNPISPIPPDYHNHTRLCKHAAGTPLDYARAACARGLTEMACTEHSPFPEPFDTAHRMDLDQFPLYLDWVRTAQEDGGLRVLLGIEADYFAGCEAHLTPWLAAHPFDIVLGSVHYLHVDRERNHALTGIWEHDDIEANWAAYFRLIGQMADTRLYDVASHLDLPKKFNGTPAPAFVERVVKPALDRIAAANMGMEINTSGWIHDAREAYPSPAILRWARERGIPISFGSDAHQPERMGAHFEEAVAWVIEAGYTERAEYHQRRRTMVPLTAATGSVTESAG